MMWRHIVDYSLALLFIISMTVTCWPQAYPQDLTQFSRTLAVSGPVILEIAIARGKLTVVQGREDRMVIAASLQGNRTQSDSNTQELPVTVEQNGSNIHLGYINDPAANERAAKLNIAFRIEAPYKTEVVSSIENGNLTIVGLDGPVRANTTAGNISVSYVMKEVSAQSGTGDLQIEAVSGRVRAKVRNGNISCMRVPEGVTAETGEGDISLQVVGRSEAKVQAGGGRIDVGGARGTLVATTDTGALHVKAVPHQDWQLRSTSGNIRIELPAGVGFEIDAVTKLGKISVRRQDMQDIASNELIQRINGGGKKIQVRSERGNVVIN